MKNLNQLTSLFSSRLDMNLARVRALSMMVLALLEARDIRLSVMSRYFNLTDAKPDSSFKRMQRFIKQVSLPFNQLASLILAVLGFSENSQLTLIFDRTNWKFGKVHINFLFLAVVHEGVSVPIFWKILQDKKQGNSSFADRIELMEKFIDVFGKKRVGCILGDREFIGKVWISWLQRKRLPYVIRLPELATHISDHKGRPCKAKSLFLGLRRGCSRSIGYCNVGKLEPYKSEVSVLKTREKELVVIIHSERFQDPQAKYRERWQIETMFRAFKTSGFNLESTHVTSPERLTQLAGVLVLAFCFAYKAGKIVISQKKYPERKMATASSVLLELA